MWFNELANGNRNVEKVFSFVEQLWGSTDLNVLPELWTEYKDKSTAVDV